MQRFMNRNSEESDFVCMFTPRNIRLMTFEDASVKGAVSQSVFLGDRTRVLVEVEGQNNLNSCGLFWKRNATSR